MPSSTRQIGDISANDQVLLLRSDKPGTDHNQYVWVLLCARRNSEGTICGHRYGANGLDFHHRRCPRCQGGAEGFKVEELV